MPFYGSPCGNQPKGCEKRKTTLLTATGLWLLLTLKIWKLLLQNIWILAVVLFLEIFRCILIRSHPVYLLPLFLFYPFSPSFFLPLFHLFVLFSIVLSFIYNFPKIFLSHFLTSAVHDVWLWRWSESLHRVCGSARGFGDWLHLWYGLSPLINFFFETR